MSVFEGKSDRYNGITVSSDEEKCDPAEFSNKLEGNFKFKQSKFAINKEERIFF